MNEVRPDDAAIGEWLPSTPPAPAGAPVRALVVGVVIVVSAAAVFAIAGPVPALLALVVLAGGAAAWVATFGTRALRSLGARKLDPSESARAINLASGLARDVGVEVPQLWVIPDGGPNALVCRSRGPAIALTQSLLDTFNRTELEAVLAHCLLRGGRAVDRAIVDAAVGGRGSPDLVAVDRRTAAATRYPPALAAAIAKAEPGRRFPSLWFAPHGGSSREATERIEALSDL